MPPFCRSPVSNMQPSSAGRLFPTCNSLGWPVVTFEAWIARRPAYSDGEGGALRRGHLAVARGDRRLRGMSDTRVDPASTRTRMSAPTFHDAAVADEAYEPGPDDIRFEVLLRGSTHKV